VIFSDSLSAIQSLDSIRPLSRPDIVEEIFELKQQINSAVTVAWIPAHVGIPGNEIADSLAKEALSNQAIDTALAPDKKEILDKIDEHVMHKWQEAWTSSREAKHYKKIQPNVNTKIKLADPNRRKEVFLTRLRLGVCPLNHYTYIQKNHPTGLCSACGVPQTIEHYLMHCRGNKLHDKIQNTCTQQKIPFEINSILNNSTILNVIYVNRTGVM